MPYSATYMGDPGWQIYSSGRVIKFSILTGIPLSSSPEKGLAELPLLGRPQ